MSETTQKIGSNLQAAYDEQYTDKMTAWRELGGKYKVDNILTVCHEYKFDRVLDCGAGEGSLLKFIANHNMVAQLFAIEISESGIKQIKKRNIDKLIEIKKFDGYTIPYPDKYFNMAYCSHVLEHVEHPRVILRELKRVSHYQVFEIPLDYSIDVDTKVPHFLSYGHINIYTPSLFKFLLKSEGFEILEESLSHTNNEINRYIQNTHMKLKSTLAREVKFMLLPLSRLLKRLLEGSDRYNEFGYSAYTCLARPQGDLKIL